MNSGTMSQSGDDQQLSLYRLLHSVTDGISIHLKVTHVIIIFDWLIIYSKISSAYGWSLAEPERGPEQFVHIYYRSLHDKTLRGVEEQPSRTTC